MKNQIIYEGLFKNTDTMKKLKSILLVEDDEDDQFFFIEAMSKIENATLYAIAKNGKEALDCLENSSTLPDIIFMDINMQIMNGIECLTLIMKNPLICTIPVVMLTTSSAQKELAHTLGAKAYIKKPWDGKLLYTQIEQMINLDFILDSDIAIRTFQVEYLA